MTTIEHSRPRIPSNTRGRPNLEHLAPPVPPLPVFDIRPPSTIMDSPLSKGLSHKPSHLMGKEADPCLTSPFQPTQEVFGAVIPRQRQLVRNSVSASDVRRMPRPVSQVAVIEYASAPQARNQFNRPLRKKRELGGFRYDGTGPHPEIELLSSAGGR